MPGPRLESTNTIDPGPSTAPATARATRTAPRKTDSNESRHAASEVSMTVPVGGPPDRDQGAVEAAEGVLRRRDQEVLGPRIAVVGHDAHRSVAQLGHRTLQGRLGATGDHHPGALGDEQVRGRSAQTTAAPGDEEDLVTHLAVHARSSPATTSRSDRTDAAPAGPALGPASSANWVAYSSA